jgi:hypothetical protein
MAVRNATAAVLLLNIGFMAWVWLRIYSGCFV